MPSPKPQLPPGVAEMEAAISMIDVNNDSLEGEDTKKWNAVIHAWRTFRKDVLERKS